MRDRTYPYGKPTNALDPLTVVLCKDFDHRLRVGYELKIPGAMYALIGEQKAGIKIGTLIVFEAAIASGEGLDAFKNNWRTRTVSGGNIFFVREDRSARY
jgi:hypothetical protein